MRVRRWMTSLEAASATFLIQWMVARRTSCQSSLSTIYERFCKSLEFALTFGDTSFWERFTQSFTRAMRRSSRLQSQSFHI